MTVLPHKGGPADAAHPAQDLDRLLRAHRRPLPGQVVHKETTQQRCWAY